MNMESNKIAKNKNYFFHVNKMYYFIWPGKTNKTKIRFFF